MTVTEAAAPELTAEQLFEKIIVCDDVYIRQEDDSWLVVACRHKHSKNPKFMVENGSWYAVDPKTMQLEKPEGFVAPRKRASSHGEISSSTHHSSGVSFSNRTTYATSRMYRPRYTTPEKPDHGFAGLKNQGATCYLNSLLQTLYMTLELRQAIFQWEYDLELDGEDVSKCMTNQLQELFARLQASRQGAATTSALTTSFGWTGSDVYQQHDVVELAQVLFDFLKEKAHDNNLKDVVGQFRCDVISYVECLEHGHRRDREPQALVGIPLALDDPEIKTIDAAIKKYLQFEIMEGDNAIMNDVVGHKTRSKKGMRFSGFHKFLCVQLGRWTLNLRTFQREKISKPIEFDLELDVAPYVNSDVPLKYELYSMMIHRGGAYGGHYFAYIKNLKTGKWFEFNDSSVTEISDEEFNRMMQLSYCNEGKKNYRSRTSPLEGAYMLMYRRIDENPMQSVSDELIPAELRDRIARDDEKWIQKKTEFWLRVTHKERTEEVVFDRNETFANQVEKVLKEFKLSPDIALENIRFRAMGNMDSKARPFEQIDRTFKEIGIDDGDPIFMEIKKPGAEFEEVEVDWIQLPVKTLDYDNEELMQVVDIGEIKIDKQGKTSQIRKECAKLLGIEPQNCKIYCQYDRDGEPDLDAMDYDSLDVEQVLRSLVEIWADKCNDFSNDETTPIFDVFEEKKHFIDLEFNTPGSQDFTETMAIDDRWTLREVREVIGSHLKIEPMSFIMGRTFDNELKKLDKELCKCYLLRRRLFLRQGTPITEGQYRVAIWMDSEEEGEERFTPLRSHFVIQSDWTLANFHANLSKEEEDLPPLELMRLRKKFVENMTEFVPAEGTLKNLGGLQDGFHIAIQRLKEAEALKKNDLILRIIQYEPKSRTCDSSEREVVISRKTAIKDLGKDALIPLIGDQIPLEHLQWGKAAAYPKSIDHIKWKSAADGDERSLQKGFFKNGCVVLYRDSREVEEDEEEDVRASESGSQGGSGRNWRSGGGATSSRQFGYRPKERGIKIFSVEEQEERSANKRRRGSSDEKMMEPYGPNDRGRGHSC